jgi:peptide/nickel transport system substrate-binding protein
MSAGIATVAAACGGQPVAPPAEEETALPATEEQPAEGPHEAEEESEAAIKRGGTWRSSMNLQLLDHPARLSWVEGANIVRQIGEYLTETGPDNITRPYLLDRWEASDDVKTWDLYLRQGITFNNGDELTTEDVFFTFGEWLNPDVGSSMAALLGDLGGIQNVEVVDDYHMRLHLDNANIGIPEFLFHYPGIILHRDFEGDIIQQPIGTGAFLLEEYADGERAVFKRREDYWRDGADGQPLPYLDELIYVSSDKDAGVAALQAGQVDTMYDPRPTDFQALKDLDFLTVRPVSTSQCLLLRMRVDLEPWDDVRVRNALKMCQDREKILQLAYFGEGDLSIDAHVAGNRAGAEAVGRTGRL